MIITIAKVGGHVTQGNNIMIILVIDRKAENRGEKLSLLFTTLKHDSRHKTGITKQDNTYQPDAHVFDLIFLHCGDQDYWQEYCKQYGDSVSIVLFSGGGENKDVCKQGKVSAIPWSINNESDIKELNWKAAFEEFEKNKTKPFPVHLLKSSLHNTYAFLILLQGYIAANFPESDKNKLLPGWNSIKDKVSIKNPELTKQSGWWGIIKTDDLLREIKMSGKDKNKIDKLVKYIETFFYIIPPSDNEIVTAIYTDLKGFISSK